MANQTAPRAAIFDFDLTLADSTRAASACIDYALVELGFDPVGSERARRTIGLSLEQTLENLTGETDSGTQTRFRSLFIRHADLVMVSQTDLFEGVQETLDALRNAGIGLGIVSTKYRFRIEDILERYQLADHFGVIVGGEDVTSHKPHPEGLISALAALGVRPSEAVYVGDHVVDAEAAMGASVPFVAVLSGESKEGAFCGFPRVGILGAVPELPRFIGSCGMWPPPGHASPPTRR